tara:strand:+ start:372 stop:533 length:162 start_codon:yes stop_codon:yes gene_type:complete
LEKLYDVNKDRIRIAIKDKGGPGTAGTILPTSPVISKKKLRIIIKTSISQIYV